MKQSDASACKKYNKEASIALTDACADEQTVVILAQDAAATYVAVTATIGPPESARVAELLRPRAPFNDPLPNPIVHWRRIVQVCLWLSGIHKVAQQRRHHGSRSEARALSVCRPYAQMPQFGNVLGHASRQLHSPSCQPDVTRWKPSHEDCSSVSWAKHLPQASASRQPRINSGR